ncbi:MAG: hypothetical protein LBQ15_00475 [Clostridium sp.]|jgi:hypothetical protein|nr:hypothetical protein [Clostridium sp.]
MNTLVNTPLAFKDKDYSFIESEFGLSRETVNALSDDGLVDLYEKCCEVEIDETSRAGDRSLTERGDMAVRLVNLIHGPYDSTEYDREMALS